MTKIEHKSEEWRLLMNSLTSRLAIYLMYNKKDTEDVKRTEDLY